MKVVWMNDAGTEATVMRGIFRTRVANIHKVAWEYSASCNSLSCPSSGHQHHWEYLTTGNPVESNVVHALRDFIHNKEWAKREAQRLGEWMPMAVLPHAKALHRDD